LRPLPAKTVATEGYAPNVQTARDRLSPLGVQVIAIDQETDHILPLADSTFDLIINRHEYYDPHEVRRILKPGGRFITQQVGGGEYPPLRTLLGDATPNDTVSHHTVVVYGLAKRRACHESFEPSSNGTTRRRLNPQRQRESAHAARPGSAGLVATGSAGAGTH